MSGASRCEDAWLLSGARPATPRAPTPTATRIRVRCDGVRRRALSERRVWVISVAPETGHPDDGFVEVEAPGAAESAGVAEGEDAAVGGDQPVAEAGPGAGHASR